MRPFIGITCAWSAETHLHETYIPFYYIDGGYGKAILKAGGMPVLMVPPTAEEVALDAYADKLLSRVDGVYFAGGAGGGKRSATGERRTLYAQQPIRSAWEDVLLKKAYARGIPVLGVCRGHQMMAEALGGALDKDSFPPHRQNPPYDQGHHTVKIAENSLLAKMVGREDWFVNSIHVQKVETTPPGFVVSAHTEDDSVEAMESVEKPFFLSTQFHPELMVNDPRAAALLSGFVSAAAQYAENRYKETE